MELKCALALHSFINSNIWIMECGPGWGSSWDTCWSEGCLRHQRSGVWIPASQKASSFEPGKQPSDSQFSFQHKIKFSWLSQWHSSGGLLPQTNFVDAAIAEIVKKFENNQIVLRLISFWSGSEQLLLSCLISASRTKISSLLQLWLEANVNFKLLWRHFGLPPSDGMSFKFLLSTPKPGKFEPRLSLSLL